MVKVWDVNFRKKKTETRHTSNQQDCKEGRGLKRYQGAGGKKEFRIPDSTDEGRTIHDVARRRARRRQAAVLSLVLVAGGSPGVCLLYLLIRSNIIIP